ncbi:MAG: sigma-70 family RNA polymerase sigma factor [Clostridiales bacterium]|nr:sigma-70 family RNA polymerase sigma factor [Clostridiales bacterium]
MTEAELTKLMKQYEALVWTVVSGILKNRRDCEEAAADVFISLWKSSFDANAVGAKSYIITLARRRAIDRLRQESREQSQPLDADSEDSDDPLECLVSDKINSKIIAEVVTSLPPPDAEIFTRRYYYNQSVKQIAAAMDLKPLFVKSRLERAKSGIRERLLARGVIV